MGSTGAGRDLETWDCTGCGLCRACAVDRPDRDAGVRDCPGGQPFGRVTFGGLPVPGATVTATRADSDANDDDGSRRGVPVQRS